MTAKSVDITADFYAINTKFKLTTVYAPDSVYTKDAILDEDITKPQEYLQIDGNEYCFTAKDKDGFLFDGWYKDGEIVTQDNALTITASNNNQVYEAKYYVNKTTFSADIPSATTITIPTLTNLKKEVTASVEVLPGHKFIGWYDVVGGEEEFITNDNNLIVAVDEFEHNYIAKFTENTLTLSQNNDNAGEIYKGYKVDFINTYLGNRLYDTQYVNSKNPLVMPQIPAGGNKYFCGWYTNEEATIPFDWSVVIDKDITLYSKWETYNSDSLRTISYYNMGEWDLTYIDDTASANKRYYYYGASHNQTVDIELATYRTSRNSSSGAHWHVYTYVRIVNETTRAIEYEKLLHNCMDGPDLVSLKLKAGDRLRIEFYYAGGDDGVGRDPVSVTSEIFKIRITDKTPVQAVSELNCASGHYHAGEKIMLKATVADGYAFDGWYIGEEQISSQLLYEYTMIDDNVTIEARFI
jgi:uncharacterized repeat protein (TIGR02543 family)